MKNPGLKMISLALCLVAGQALAGGGGAPPPTAKPAPAPVTVAVGPTIPSSETPVGKQGKFIVTYEGTKVPGMDAVRRKLAKEGIIQTLLNVIASDLPLPQDVPVTFKDCGEPNAFWQPNDKTVTFCYEMLATYSNGYGKLDKRNAALLEGMSQDDILYGTTLFIMFHELGHGVIGLYNLPTTGKEEDAVDQLATLSLIELDALAGKNAKLNELPSRWALLGAYMFNNGATSVDTIGKLSKQVDVGRILFSDEHSLGQQRFYDIMCLTLGSNEDKYMPLILNGVARAEEYKAQHPKEFDTPAKILALYKKYDDYNLLPFDRAARCEGEFKHYDGAWNTLLNDYIRNPKR